jgi:hypothetical protein
MLFRNNNNNRTHVAQDYRFGFNVMFQGLPGFHYVYTLHEARVGVY